MTTLTAKKPVIAVADDGSGRVWVVNDGTGRSWYKPGANESWLPVVGKGWFSSGADEGWLPVFNHPAKLPSAQDVYDNFEFWDVGWFAAEVAEILETLPSRVH